MLLHQFILVLVSAFKRFESHLLHLPGELRRIATREQLADSDLPDARASGPPEAPFMERKSRDGFAGKMVR